LRVLVLTKDGSTFLRYNQGGNGVDAQLEEEKAYPTFPTAYLVKYAPCSGSHAAIIDEIGIHFVDMVTGKERLQIVKPGIGAMEYSPRDTYLITCEKYS
jgi:hypothetical protein